MLTFKKNSMQRGGGGGGSAFINARICPQLAIFQVLLLVGILASDATLDTATERDSTNMDMAFVTDV
jgi:hypothetical protein